MGEHILIIGGGQSAVQLADSLRSEGFAGKLTLISQDTELPYQRPPLSKDFMAEGAAPELLPLRAESFYEQQDIDLIRATRVEMVDPRARIVHLHDGRQLGYDKLVFATGARNRPLPCPGGDLEGVHGLRDAADAHALHAALPGARRVVVIGAGFIGLEFAAAARARGIEVTVLEFAPRPMGRAVSAPLSGWFTKAHLAAGIQLRLEEGVAEIAEHSGGLQVLSSAGNSYLADLVVYGVGVLPNAELAEAAGVPVDNGITVDEQLRTGLEGIYALGDCANFPSVHCGSSIRLESVQNATDQARTLARILTGQPQPYRMLPWFWSTQGSIRLQIAGLATPGDEPVVLGDLSSGKFSIALLREGVLVAVESVNRPADHIAARKLLSGGQRITVDRLEGITSLKELSAPMAPVA